MRRTIAFVAVTLALAIPSLPFISEAQQPKKVAKIGYLLPSTPGGTAELERRVSAGESQPLTNTSNVV